MTHIPNFPIKLKALRLMHGVHQRDLARRANIHVQLLVDIEKGRAFPGPEQLTAIEQVLGVRFDEQTEAAFAVLAPQLARSKEVANGNGH